MDEVIVKTYGTRDLLKLFFEKAQRSYVKKENPNSDIPDYSLSLEEETEMYIMYAELNRRACEYDRIKK